MGDWWIDESPPVGPDEHSFQINSQTVDDFRRVAEQFAGAYSGAARKFGKSFADIAKLLRQQKVDRLTKEYINKGLAPRTAKMYAEFIVRLEEDGSRYPDPEPHSFGTHVHFDISGRSYTASWTDEFNSLTEPISKRDQALAKKQQNAGPRSGKKFGPGGRAKY